MKRSHSLPAQEYALARFAVIAPLVARQLDLPEIAAVRHAILHTTHCFPGDRPRRVSRRTLGRWLAAYLIDEAVALRHELATLSTADILAHLKTKPKEATLAYHLRQRGLTRKALKADGKAFPRYEAATVNATWQSDVTEGFWPPDPTEPGKFRQVYLMGFLDDHSRLIAHGEWYFKKSLPCLFDCMTASSGRKTVWSRRPAASHWRATPTASATPWSVARSRSVMTRWTWPRSRSLPPASSARSPSHTN